MTFQDLSPEARALLQEVSEDPDAAIRRLAEHANRNPRTGRRRSEEGAIQQLAEVHRYEVALLLARHAQQRLFSDPFWEGILHRSLHVDEELRVPRGEDVTKEAAMILRSTPLSDGDRSHLYRIQDGAPFSAFEAAQASWRILGMDAAAMMLALEYMRREQWESCRRILDLALERSVSSLNLSIAWELVGMMMLRTGRLPDTIDAYRRSAATEQDRPAPLIFAFVLSAMVGSSEARSFAEQIDGMVSDADPVVVACVGAIRTLRSRGILDIKIAPTIRLSDFAAGPATSRIVDAVH